MEGIEEVFVCLLLELVKSKYPSEKCQGILISVRKVDIFKTIRGT